jgi:hypothetical protein
MKAVALDQSLNHPHDAYKIVRVRGQNLNRQQRRPAIQEYNIALFECVRHRAIPFPNKGSFGAGYGLYGSNSGTTGLGIGTYGVGFNGVYGQTTNTATGWSGYFTADIGVEGAGFAIGGWQLASDRRLKTNIVPIKNALSQLSLIQGTHYTITTPTTSANGEKSSVQRQQYGVIAQDVELVFPELIKEKALFINQGDETVYKTVDYIQLVPVMIEAIKELNTEVERLKKELEEMKQR